MIAKSRMLLNGTMWLVYKEALVLYLNNTISMRIPVMLMLIICVAKDCVGFGFVQIVSNLFTKLLFYEIIEEY